MPASVVGLLFALSVALAEVDKSGSGTKPDISFIEYLGTWETASGKWVDPTQLDDRQEDTDKRRQDGKK